MRTKRGQSFNHRYNFTRRRIKAAIKNDPSLEGDSDMIGAIRDEAHEEWAARFPDKAAVIHV